ncbi:MAG: CRISPR-associated endonuclease Cas1 [Thermodesulfovibrionales bacterium]
MKKLLNTLFVTTQGAYLAKEGETVAVKINDAIALRVPIHTLGGIVCFGQVSCSPYLMGFCAENQVAISFLTENGRFLAKVQGPVSGNVLLRREQYRRADDLQTSSQVARAIVTGKIANCRNVLQRCLRDHTGKTDDGAVSQASQCLANSLRRLQSDSPLDFVRGLEGDAANSYFGVFDHLSRQMTSVVSCLKLKGFQSGTSNDCYHFTKSMRRWLFVPQTVAQIPLSAKMPQPAAQNPIVDSSSEILQQLVAKFLWGHNICNGRERYWSV